MRKEFLLLLIAFIAWGIFPDANADIPKTPKKEIIIKDQPKSTKHTHRAPAKVQIEASYNSFMSAIAITFLQDLGNMTVNVTNHSTGEYLEGTMTATTGVTMLPVSGTEGFYTITFTLNDGTEYYGEFEL